MTLTAEGLRVLPGQLPFQRPAGEGKAYRAEPAKQTGWAWCTPGTLAASSRWVGDENPPPTYCLSLSAPRLEGGPCAQPCRPLNPRAGGSPPLSQSLCMSSVLRLAGPSTRHALLRSNPPLPR